MANINIAHMLCIHVFGYATGISTIDINVCINNGSFPSVDIDCSNNSIIHLESIHYFYNQGSDCNTEPCGQPLTNSSTGLTSPCTGESSCTQRIPNNDNCTGSTIRYRCIESENIKDMCDKDFELELSGMIFLSSPQYPGLVNGLTEESCECSIRGTSITYITILDLTLKTSDGTRSNLFIQYGDIRYNKTSRDNSQSPLQVYNHRLQTTTTTADIIFTHQQINELKLWIEIQGTGLGGFCNKQTTSTYLSSTHSEISTSTTAYPTSAATNHMTPSETSPGTSSGPTSNTPTSPTDKGLRQTDNDKDVVIIVLATILPLSLVLVIVLCLLYRKYKLNCLRQPDNPSAENPRTITQLESGSNYSNLSDVTRNNKDNTYQELQTRNSNSPYTNLPYSSSSEMEAGTNYSSLSDGNKLDTDNHGYQELQTRTPTSPYNNLPYT